MKIETKCTENLIDGFRLFRNGRVKELREGHFNVHSFNGVNYKVTMKSPDYWTCECNENTEPQKICKEIIAVLLFIISRGIIR